ncbi:MAG: hypothetical protein PHD36_07565 [Desulfotomaculaceae bacterium]|nr:hypothetical protein [Desulfotomaculaceae bacterium]
MKECQVYDAAIAQGATGWIIISFMELTIAAYYRQIDSSVLHSISYGMQYPFTAGDARAEIL